MKITYRLCNLDCGVCASKMEDAVKKIEGIKNVSISFLSQKMVVETDAELSEAMRQQIETVCRRVEPDCVLS